MGSKLHIYAASLNQIVGDLSGNKARILAAYRKGQDLGADIVLLNELVTIGYPALDILDKPQFCEQVFALNESIAAETADTILVFGSILPNHYMDGPTLLNVAIVAQNGTVSSYAEKQLLPNYDVFDEKRYFKEGQPFSPIELKGEKIGIVICEDLWGNDNERIYSRYAVDPVNEQIKAGASILLSMSASPYRINKAEYRTNLVCEHAKRHKTPMIDVNQAGANTELVFDGIVSAANSEGVLVKELPLFQENAHFLAYQDGKLTSIETISDAKSYQRNVTLHSSKYAQIFEALKIGLADYLGKSKAAQQVVLGLSGGIDSALVAVIAKEALGKEQLWCVGMPSEFSSEGSVSDAELLAKNLDIRFDLIAIKELYKQYEASLAPFFKGMPFSVAEENLQSRTRGTLLMAIANKFGAMVLNTGNKSEMATGYCTLYGDMNGGLSLLGDLYKTEVFELCAWLNETYFKDEIIPFSIISKPPSAELRPNQKDIDSLPDYDELDQILKLYIDSEWTRAQIIEQIAKPQLVEQICRLVDLNEHKRNQAPPIIKLHPKSFGSGRRWPIVANTRTC